MSEMAAQTCRVRLPLDDACAALVANSLQTELSRKLLNNRAANYMTKGLKPDAGTSMPRFDR
jgi:hypothetical protein